MALATFNNPSPNLTLSNNNTRAHRTTNSGPLYQRCSVSTPLSGKVYFEMNATHAANNTPSGMVLYGGDKTVAQWPVSDAMGYWWGEPGYSLDTYDRWSVNIRGNSSNDDTIQLYLHLYDNLPSLPSQIRIQVAIDVSTRSVWARTNLGSGWVGGGNPETGTSPTFVVAGSSPIWAGAVSGHTGNFVDLTHPDNYSGVAPAGYALGISDGSEPQTDAPANTGAPVVTGNSNVGSVLSVSPGTWTGTPTPTITYQWTRNAVPVVGANGTSYAIPMAAVGDSFGCIVTATNTAGAFSTTTNAIVATAAEAANRIKPLVNYSGEFSVIQSGDVLDTTAGGTGLAAFIGGSYLKALNSSTLEMVTPLAMREEMRAVAFTCDEVAPSLPLSGDEWLKPSTGRKYIWYVDGDSGQWIELESTSIVGGSGGSGSAPPTYIQDTQPNLDSPFVWVQTGLGEDGTGVTLWFNDNT